MDRYPCVWPLSWAGLLIGAVLTGAAAIWVPISSAAQESQLRHPLPSAPIGLLPLNDACPRPVAAASHTRVLMLCPSAFTEFQNAVSGLEAIPDWTQAARKNLSDAARDTLQATGGLQLEAMPDLTPEEALILRDYIAWRS